MSYDRWSEMDIIDGYLRMAEINSFLAEEFFPLENEAEKSNLEFILNFI